MPRDDGEGKPPGQTLERWQVWNSAVPSVTVVGLERQSLVELQRDGLRCYLADCTNTVPGDLHAGLLTNQHISTAFSGGRPCPSPVDSTARSSLHLGSTAVHCLLWEGAVGGILKGLSGPTNS